MTMTHPRLTSRVALLALVAAAGCRTAAAPSWSVSGPPPGAPAVRFSPDVVNRTSAFASAFTPDGKTIFFTASDSAPLMAGRETGVRNASRADGIWLVTIQTARMTTR